MSGLEAPNVANCPLPKGHTSMADIIDGNVSVNTYVTVTGLVKDWQPPIQSRGTDYKMAIKLFDKSLEADCRFATVHFFGAKEEMPAVGAGDVVLVQGAKVQKFRDDFSLLTNYGTVIDVFKCEHIPQPPALATPNYRPPRRNRALAVPSVPDLKYVSWLYHSIDKGPVPTVVEFQALQEQAMNTRYKFTCLGDVGENEFRNLVVMVVNEPYETSGSMSIWVTDFSENCRFCDFPRPGTAAGSNGNGQRPGDEYGYLTKFTGVSRKTMQKWTGPFGKLSMLVTCYEPHVSYIRSHVQAGNWVMLENVQVKMGSNGSSLEGFLRDDVARGSPLRVELLEIALDDPESVDPRLKEAIRRKRDYERQNKSMLKKRKQALEDAKSNSSSNAGNAKGRRKRARQAAQGENQPSRKASQQHLLNKAVVTDHASHAAIQLSSVLQPAYHEITSSIGDQIIRMPLPFINAKFRAQVRVVDFMPMHLEDFAVGRKATEFDLLSDDGNDEATNYSSSSDEGEGAGTLNAYMGERVWEWRFALLLEDATPHPQSGETNGPDEAGQPRARVWATVDDSDAQMLTNLSACELRKDWETLQALREKMFLLWGDLEEKKMEALRAQRVARKKAAQLAEAENKRKQQQLKEQKEAEKRAEAQRAVREALAEVRTSNLQSYPAPMDMSDDVQPDDTQSPVKPGQGQRESEKETAATTETQQTATAQTTTESILQKVHNRPFVCCLNQYGIRVPVDQSVEESGDEDGGPEWKWQQMFGMFGTKIGVEF